MKLKAVTDTTLTLKHGKIEQQINRKDIVALQQKQLSAGKTIALVTPITTITLTALILTALFH